VIYIQFLIAHKMSCGLHLLKFERKYQMKKFLIIAIAVSMIFSFTMPAMADSSSSDAAAEAGITQIDNSIHEAADLNRGRGFAIPGDVQYGPVLNYFGQPLPSEGFQPVEQLIMYSCWFTDGALESMLRGVEKADAEFKVANTRIADAPAALEDGKTKWIKIVISRDKYDGENVGFKGFITAKSENRDTTMTEVMAKAALTALQNGCNVIHFTAQGAVRDVMSSGWGIGFNTTQAQVYSGDLTKSNVSSGGMGYSSAKAGTRDLPWLQGFGLIDNDLVYPALDLPAEQIDANNSVLKPAPKMTAANQATADVPQTSVRINPAD
jgi:hypothetical protein